jgi:hypothetical protein
MVESTPTTANDLRSAIEVALAAGVVTRDEILDMVSTDSPDAGSNGHAPPELAVGSDDLPIYTELPDGLIDLPTAATRYECKGPTLRMWVHRGHLKLMGRLKGSCTGGGYLVVSESDLKERLSTPNKKGGRPPKTRNG